MIEDHRRKRLQEMIDFYGGQAKLADQVDVSAGFISQLITKRRPFTEKTARKFEDALSLPRLWFDIDETDGFRNVSETDKVRFDLGIPLISWVRAGEFCEAQDPLTPGDAEEWMPRPAGASDRSYALRVVGDSMTSPYPGQRSYPQGMIILVDPEKEVLPGSRGIFKTPESNEVTFKELVNDMGNLYLKPLNPQYDKIKVTEDMITCGKVIAAIMPE